MAGSLQKIDISKLSLEVTAKTTPVIVLDEDQRFQVDWDFGDLQTINLYQAKRLLHPKHGYMSIAARLRQGSALSLRQQLLSNVGRVGELAPLPRSTRFQAKAYLPLQEGGTEEITMPEGVTITGNVIISRRGKFATAIIDSNCEDDLTEALLGLDFNQIARPSLSKLEKFKEQTRIHQIFRSGFQGIKLPLNNPRNAGFLKLGEEQPDSDDKRPKIDIVATIVTGKNFEVELGNNLKGAGLIVQISLEENV